MGGEYFLTQDPLNFNDELCNLIFYEKLNKQDLCDIYENGYISKDDLDFYIDYINFLKGG